MNINHTKTLLIVAALTLPLSTHATLFAETPLQHAYQATLTKQPKLAWQELILALSQHPIESRYWLPIKNEVLTQTDCGSQILTMSAPDMQLRLSLIKRSGLASQGYQFRLSTENTQQALPVTLTSPEGELLLSGRLNAKNDYQEIESDELLQAPSQGLFQLTLGENKIPLLLASPSSGTWLSLIHRSEQIQVRVSAPTPVPSCPKAAASWQWFDQNYNLIGTKIPFNSGIESIPNDHKVRKQAKYLSASVELVEFQQGIRIEYIQRLAIPYR